MLGEQWLLGRPSLISYLLLKFVLALTTVPEELQLQLYTCPSVSSFEVRYYIWLWGPYRKAIAELE